MIVLAKLLIKILKEKLNKKRRRIKRRKAIKILRNYKPKLTKPISKLEILQKKLKKLMPNQN